MGKKIAQIVLLASGIGIMIFGIANGETAVVMRKAAAICLECIGIG